MPEFDFELKFIILSGVSSILLIRLLFHFFKILIALRIRKNLIIDTPVEDKLYKKNILKKFFILISHLIFNPFRIRNFAQKSMHSYQIGKIRIPYLSLWFFKNTFTNLLLIFVIYFIANQIFLKYPNIINVYPANGEIWDDYSKPYEITFDIPINQEKIILNLYPETKGKWEFEKSFSFLPFSRKAKFFPEESIFPGEQGLVYLTDVTNHFNTKKGGEHALEYISIELPQIVSTNPENDSTDFPIDKNIEIQLSSNDGNHVLWEVDPIEGITHQIINSDSNKFNIQFDNNLKQSTTYQLKIYRTALRYNLSTGEIIEMGDKMEQKVINFTTVKAPLISDNQPQGANILADAKIQIVFDTPMDQGSVRSSFSVTPETKGEIAWTDDKTFIFTPEILQKETEYTVTIAKGAKNQLGGFFEEDFSYSFTTIGRVRVIGWSPISWATGVKTSATIGVTFDQAIDHASAQSKFSISPSVSGTFSWNGNTMYFKPSSMGYQTKYTITVASGVKSVYGLDSNASFSSSFTTESQIFSLNVPLYRQTHTFTCNVTAIAMALAYKGRSASEMSVYNGIGKDNTPCTKSGTTITYWGNPNAGYVGDINGGGDCGGYGVHWSPSSSYIASQGVSNSVISGWSASQLAKEIEKGHPAVLWWQNGASSAYWKTWASPSGNVNALNGMHSEVVIGFIGSSDNPTHMITNDPWRGRRTIAVGTFNALWGYFGRTAIIIY